MDNFENLPMRLSLKERSSPMRIPAKNRHLEMQCQSFLSGLKR